MSTLSNASRLRRALASGAVATVLIGTSSPMAAAAGELDGIVDPALRACVTRNITQYNVAAPSKLESLLCKTEDGVVRQLTGVDALVGLKNLILQDSEVTNLEALRGLPGLLRVGIQTTGTLDPSPLVDLPDLFWLQLRERSRSEISFVPSLSALTTLTLELSPTADLSPVLDASGLETLGIWADPDTDLSILSELPARLSLSLVATGERFPEAPRTARFKLLSASGASLTTLDGLQKVTADSGRLAGSQLTDLAAVSSMGFTDLYTNLSAGVDVSPLGELTSLRTVDLGQRSPASLAPLCALPHLESLSLNYAGQKDLTGLAGCTTLTELKLRANDVVDLTPLRKLAALRSLDLSANKLVDVAPLGELTALRSLDLSSNEITDISALRTLADLREIDVDYNEITDLSPLGNASGLTSLSATWNPVKTLGAPGSLKNLELLDVATRGRLTTLDALLGTTRLTQLKLHGNLISDLTPLTSLPDDATIDLRGNRVHDFSPLTGWAGTLLATGQVAVLPEAKQGRPFPVRILDHHGKPLTASPQLTADYSSDSLTYQSLGFHQNRFWSGRSEDTSAITVLVQQSVTEGDHLKVVTKPVIPWANPRIGKPITFSKTPTWSPTPTSITYRWFRDASPISGANQSSYTPVAADAGSSVWVEVTAHRTGYADTVVNSNYTDNIPHRTLTKTPTPKLAHQGKLKAGSILTANPGTWDTGTTLKYQWQRDRKNISGATAKTYQVTAADAGHKLRVRVTGSKVGYLSKSGYPTVRKYSKEVTPAKATFAASPKPTIIGTRAVGRRLTASVDWTPTGKLEYQWYRNGKKIKGATKASYTLKSSDLNDRFSVRVTASQTGYTTVVKTSAKTGKVKRGTLVTGQAEISGRATVGTQLSAVSTGWGPGTVKLSYRWYRDGTAIKQATSPSYRLTTADAGKALTVRVTGSKAGYTAATVVSEPITPTAE